MNTATPELRAFCDKALSRAVAAEVTALGETIRARHRNVLAVLAYGSCLRGVDPAETLIDYYVLTESFAGVSANAISRMACAMVPPNVYYIEVYYIEEQSGASRLRAKYAVLPLHVFREWMKRDVLNPYFWARFSQPSALLFARDGTARKEVVAAIAAAHETFFANAKALGGGGSVWAAGLRATYASELRPEPKGRAEQIIAADPAYYAEAQRLLAHVAPHGVNGTLRRVTGKLWSLARLAKAAFTFQGGADYLAWKIERHSGEKIELKPWQRRHPIVAGLLLLPALRRKGAVR
jgi:hypothetical protein